MALLELLARAAPARVVAADLLVLAEPAPSSGGPSASGEAAASAAATGIAPAAAAWSALGWSSGRPPWYWKLAVDEELALAPPHACDWACWPLPPSTSTST